MSVAFVGLGSNLGDRAGHLRNAISTFKALPGLTKLAHSSFRQTAPIGGPAQPNYVNAVVQCEVSLAPIHFLRQMLAIELCFGRVRQVANGPRTLDLDLLLYGTCQSSTTFLQLPHPRLCARRFVLEPMAQLAPRLVLCNGFTAEQQLASLE